MFLFTFYKDKNMKLNVYSITPITFHVGRLSGGRQELVHLCCRGNLAGVHFSALVFAGPVVAVFCVWSKKFSL